MARMAELGEGGLFKEKSEWEREKKTAQSVYSGTTRWSGWIWSASKLQATSWIMCACAVARNEQKYPPEYRKKKKTRIKRHKWSGGWARCWGAGMRERDKRHVRFIWPNVIIKLNGLVLIGGSYFSFLSKICYSIAVFFSVKAQSSTPFPIFQLGEFSGIYSH